MGSNFDDGVHGSDDFDGLRSLIDTASFPQDVAAAVVAARGVIGRLEGGLLSIADGMRVISEVTAATAAPVARVGTSGSGAMGGLFGGIGRPVPFCG